MQYINVAYKKVILYIDEPLIEINAINTQKIDKLKEMFILTKGVTGKEAFIKLNSIKSCISEKDFRIN